MRYLIFLLLPLLFACTKTSSSISPLQAAGCDVETAVVGAEAGAIATLLTCANPGQIQTDLMTALGNANLCSAQGVSAVSSAQLQSKAVSAKGVVGTIACPIVINVLIGYASQAVPTTWSCSTGATAQSLIQVLATACQAAVPI